MKNAKNTFIIAMLLFCTLFIGSASAAPFTVDEYTKILLHFDGVDQSTTFIDETGRNWTAVGGAKLWNATYDEGNASGRFANAGHHYIYTNNTTDLVPGKQDFTLEFSLKLMNLTTAYYIIGNDPASGLANASLSSFDVYMDTSNHLKFMMANGTSYKLIVSDGVIPDLNWHKFIVQRQGNQLYMFMDGVMIGEGDLHGHVSVASDGNWSIAKPGSYEGYWLNGYLDELRYSVGIARYPQAAPKYYAYGDSITYAAAYGLNSTGYDCYINQMVRNHDTNATAKRSTDGSAMTSAWGVANFPEHYINGTEIMFLEFGVNDVSTNVSAVTCANNIITMYTWAEANGTRCIPLIQTIMFDKGQGYSSRQLSVQQAYIANITSRLDAEGIEYITIYDAIDSVPGNDAVDLANESLLNVTDGVHPTAQGHYLISEYMWAFLTYVAPSAVVDEWDSIQEDNSGTWITAVGLVSVVVVIIFISFAVTAIRGKVEMGTLINASVGLMVLMLVITLGYGVLSKLAEVF